MGETVEHADGEPVKMKKKTKKEKNMTRDQLPSGDGDNVVEKDRDRLKKDKMHKLKEKKRKSESKEDGGEGQRDKGCLVNDDLQKNKKRKRRHSSEEAQLEEDERDRNSGSVGENDCDPKPEKKKKKKIDGLNSAAQIEENERDRDTRSDVEKDCDPKPEQKRKKKKKIDGQNSAAQIEENERDRDTRSDVEKDCDPKPEQKRKKKKKIDSQNSEAQIEDNELGRNSGSVGENDCDPKPEQKRKKKKKMDSQNSEAQIEENEPDRNAGSDVEKDCDPVPEKTRKKKKKLDGKNVDTEMSKKVEIKSVEKQMVKDKNKKIAPVENVTEKPKSKSKSKRVSFSGNVEVFPTSEAQPDKETTKGDGLLRGKRFTPEEDAIVKQAVLDYITAQGLGDDGLKMVLNCRSYKGMKKCWQEIGRCIPYRPYSAVYYRAHTLFERSESRSWTPEEFELLREYHANHGNDWKKIGDELGKHRLQVKDTWRRIKLDNFKKGKWSQEEYQNLYDLVNLDLQLKVSGDEKRTSKHGMLRDNIPWTAISEKLTTRSDALCCMKWYGQLTSPLVAEKKWADADDYRMIGALYEIDAACADDVDWDNLLEHRPGDICLQRWNQMVRHIGGYGSKSFGEQVDILAKRYCPDIAEVREDWDSRPVDP